MNTQINELLYHYNEEGNEGYDLNEVQLLEKIDPDRVEKLKLLLHNDDHILLIRPCLFYWPGQYRKDLSSLISSSLKNGMKKKI
ncbi:hypothetical protein EJ377_01820 [Chryseobacterium arthrosphaerae]|uniref:Uncharacterized protein n=1 Tax=Chryseobacterium arthrosphaerae TaxID=651561 RepID=A0A3S0N4K5_9FLAO|nr:hypothetical protein EJ377_01820 [Chryseobacterium arthrosphaerae]